MSHITTPQMQTLKAAILADPQAVQRASGPGTDYSWIADWLNAAGSKIVWRSSVTRTEAMANMDWTRVDNLSVGKSRIWDWMFDAGSVDPSTLNVRNGVDAVWVGTAADLAVRATVYAACKRTATRAEGFLATGTGTDVSPATATLTGNIDAFHIGEILAS